MNEREKAVFHLKIIEGQARGIVKLIEDDKSLEEIVMELHAIRSTIDKVIIYMVGENMMHCMQDVLHNDLKSDKAIQEAIALLMKSR